MNEKRWYYFLIVIGSVLTVWFCIMPFMYMVLTSLSDKPDFLSAQIGFNASLRHYHALFSTRSLHFIDFLRNSVIISFASALACMLIASLAAYAVTRLPLRGKSGILFFVLAVSMFPQISLISYLFKLMTRLGWVNTYFALLFPYISWTLPLALWVLVSYFAQIPLELDNAALIDGCSRWQILYKVIFPVATPGLISTFLLAFIFAFNEFMFALILTTDHSARTIPVGIALFEGLHGQIPWGTIMAGSAIAVIPVIMVTIVFQRYIIQGLTHGAVKG